MRLRRGCAGNDRVQRADALLAGIAAWMLAPAALSSHAKPAQAALSVSAAPPADRATLAAHGAVRAALRRTV